MVAVRVVQAAVDNVVDVVAVRHRFVAAAFTVDMVAAIMGMVADIGMGGAHFQHMFVVMTVVGVVQMAVVHIIDVVAVADGDVAASFAMYVVVVRVDFTGTHDISFLRQGKQWAHSTPKAQQKQIIY